MHCARGFRGTARRILFETGGLTRRFGLHCWTTAPLRAKRLAALVTFFGDPFPGWQRAAMACVDAAACGKPPLISFLTLTRLRAHCCYPRRAWRLSRLHRASHHPEFRMPSDCMRVLLFRRLRLPLPHTPRRRRCGGTLDALGDHRASQGRVPHCRRFGPRRRAGPLERAAARLCKEAGARVATSVALRDGAAPTGSWPSRGSEGDAATGSSSNEHAFARSAANEAARTVHRPATRQGARWRAVAFPRKRRNVSVLRLMRPPSSTPNTTSLHILHRLARWSSGYVRCFRSRA